MVLVNMIVDTKTQNIIVITTLILGIVSGLGLATSSSYFAGSYALVTNMEFDLLEVRITNFDPTNESIDPRITLVFNIKTPTGYFGDASLSYIQASVALNGDRITYSQTQWRKNIPTEDRHLFPGYDMNFTMGETLPVLSDKQILYDAESSGAWNFTIVLTISYRIFDSRTSFRGITFSHEGYT